MNRIRLFAVGAVLIFTLNAAAQQATASPSDTTKEGSGGAQGYVPPTVEDQLKLLTDRLELNGDQQVKVKGILDDLNVALQKLVKDETMSRDERMSNVRAGRYKADKQIRAILNDEQKLKLDQLEQEPHPELHGNVNPPA